MWYYDNQGTTAGPVDVAEVRRLMAAGLITPATRVWREGFADWLPAGQTELAQAPPPPLPTPMQSSMQGPPGLGTGPGMSMTMGTPMAAMPMQGAPMSLAYPAGPMVRGVHFAGFWIRLLAAFIDGLILEAISLAVGFLVGSWARLQFPDAMSDPDGMGVALVGGMGGLLGLIWGILYYTAIPAGRWQATPGKRIVGIHVVKVSGRRMGFWSFLWRYLAYFVSSIIFGIGFLMAGWTREKRALHDMMCETRVIYGRL